ncbi:TPA: protein-ADP-ribose hydrolase [Streptococcus suis]|uniref:protein-ADP-ribose hydrolase n=1 Tax=Streptococcus suis TaxID=1307 RepID=UPI0019618D98|nr:protein-ADP-ribose hydrolase [Streptococcus suis]MBM7153110.1 protein-ADP-ribose hydrolase [Streptococcus suis]MDG4502903.1 protein-ADP-ribose hydrolase [Streptococcus suis]MDW8767112.1 protein-ADP-ribose hydrolase [Streptococcus suis]HEL1614520.1 protein-ADP-ribose hydrolase [Streptococcus suis]HEM5005317.1 protein-ADP-ribose hydrolase [Streptococcus suis]
MERLEKLIAYLVPDLDLPQTREEQEWVLRALMNIWEPKVMPVEFWSLQDAYLQEKLTQKRVTGLSDLQEVEPQIYLWQGDITCLKVDAIVNAANSQLLGCFVPHHRCIDNAIHSQAGLQLRLACYQLMKAQGHLEATGQAKITPAYNLPANYVIHTVGPIIQTEVRPQDEALLASSYQKSLELAVEKGLTSIAFCCISTGEFRFPQKLAAEIAVRTVRNFIKEHPEINVIFNVFKDEDKENYQKLLKC